MSPDLRSRLVNTSPVDDLNIASQDLPRKHRPDYWLLIIMNILLVIGLVVIYSISQALGLVNNVSSTFFISRQIIAVLLGTVAFLVAFKIPIEWWAKYYKILLFLAATATLAALVLPVNPAYPAHRWVRLGSLSFESIELVIFAALIGLAVFFAKRIKLNQLHDVGKTLWPLGIILAIAGLVVAGLQSDFGSMAVLVIIVATMAYVSGMPMKKLVIIGSVIIVAAVLAISITPYRRQRLLTFLHPTSNCLTTGYQSCQALIAVGSGGWSGLGLGRSTQAYGYLPESADDSIFAIFGEKFGFVGSIILLLLFIAFFYRLKNIAVKAPNDFTRLFVFALLVWLSMESIINIGAMIGLLPLKGITLPFISYGGTSIVFIMAATGIAFKVSQYTMYDERKVRLEGKQSEDRLNRRRLGGTYNTSPGSRA